MKKTKSTKQAKQSTVKNLELALSAAQESLRAERKKHGEESAYYANRVNDLVNQRTSLELRVTELTGRIPLVVSASAIGGMLIALLIYFITKAT